MEKALSKFLTEKLKEILSEIYPCLRLSCLWLEFARAYDKDFRLAVNYTKGHGAWFHAWLKSHYPVILLLRVKSTHGTRQDIIYSSLLDIHLDRLPNIESLEH